ncbi:MAG: CapA family protein [Planctomycetota bacterium]
MRVRLFWIYSEILLLVLFCFGSFVLIGQKLFFSPSLEELQDPIFVQTVSAREETEDLQEVPSFQTYPFDVTIECFSEERKRIPYCSITVSNRSYTCDQEGRVTLYHLLHPEAAVARATGFLPEPFLIGRTSVAQRVFLWKSQNRVSIHLCGDVMFGRRYQESSSEREALVPLKNVKAGSEELVQNIAPAFSCADIGSANLESVLGSLPSTKGYPRKRFLIHSPPDCVYGLKKMGVTLANLANNHSYDYQQEGVQSTLTALKKVQIHSVGVGLTEKEAATPFSTTIRENRIAFFSFSTVAGDVINRKYPSSEKIAPNPLPPKEEWLWEQRLWGFSSSFLILPKKQRRLGDIWRIFQQYELILTETQIARLWNSLIKVYPEIQDWGARRGHGGANLWKKNRSRQQIRNAKKDHDLVIVQFHSGFQFAEVASKKLRVLAYRAIDAGADLVFAHHPHVLQGIEWYKGKLICYSFGNGVFEQRFLKTFDSAYLRLIWEKNRLLEARIYAMSLERYVPIFVTDQAARQIFATLFERSVSTCFAEKKGRRSLKIPSQKLRKEATPPHFQIENHTAVLLPQPSQTKAISFNLKPAEIRKLPEDGLFSNKIQGEGSAVFFGRDLFPWGHFENVDCDDDLSDKIHWSLRSPLNTYFQIDPLRRSQILVLKRTWFSHRTARISPMGRIPIPRYRFYSHHKGTFRPLDGKAHYSFYFYVKKTGRGAARIRLKGFSFDDSDPTKQPETAELPEFELPIPIQESKEFQQIHLELPQELFTPPSGLYSKSNFLLFFVEIEPPDSELFLDDLHFIEWRKVNKISQFEDYRFIKNTSDQELFVELTQLQWTSH